MFDEGRGEQGCFLKRDERKAFEFGASRVPNRKMEALFVTLYPGGGEAFGTVLELGGKRYPMEPGDSICFSSTIPHRWRIAGKDTLRALWGVTPPTF